MTTVPQMIFFHVGWMKWYRGTDEDDPTIGPHGYLEDNRFGYECYNFLPRAGKCYGYVPKGINISKLSASGKHEFVDNVVCVWVAKDPKRKIRVIVGWYREGRVFRSSNHQAEPSGNKIDGHEVPYLAHASENCCTLVPVPRRMFKIPTRHEQSGGLGQSTIWYGRDDEFRQRVWEYIKSWEIRKQGNKRRSTSSKHTGGRRNTNSKKRKEIEVRAVDEAVEFFSSEDGGGYTVTSRERDNVGWDLEAHHPSKQTLLIEVKGLSGKEVSVELTPNEYKQMMMKTNRNKYVLFVVTNCLGEPPLAHDYRFKDDRWSDADGTELEISERTGAVCRSKR